MFCVQANVWCTSSRARKVIISLTLVVLTVQVINVICRTLANVDVVEDILTVFRAIMPVSVLVINVVVVVKVRRAAINAAANLGVQPHHRRHRRSAARRSRP